jgi:E3 ubiquitin-protein ligase NRDP1
MSSKEVHLSADNRHAFLYENNYLFRSIVANQPFMEGKHYWEIVADSRTEHEYKIGVSLQQRFSQTNAFCDYDFGFAYYGLGELRHGSNGEGCKYGKPFKKHGILGVYLDMSEGTLAFALDGQYFGTAFKDPMLKKGPIWACVSMLHQGGCTLVSGLKVPDYFN